MQMIAIIVINNGQVKNGFSSKSHAAFASKQMNKELKGKNKQLWHQSIDIYF